MIDKDHENGSSRWKNLILGGPYRLRKNDGRLHPESGNRILFRGSYRPFKQAEIVMNGHYVF
jgi:hypothetical protein